MNFETFGELNWLAVIVGAVIYFALGAIWFQPAVLGRPWMRSIGYDPQQRPPDMSPTAYVLPALFYVVAAIATGLLGRATATDELGEGIVLGLVVGVGYALMVTAVDAVFDPNKPQPWTWFVISGAYHLLGLMVVAVIVAIWR
jgi:MFS superfamily sulfate permease-like transporter